MYKNIFLILLFFSSVLFSQNFSNEKYERFVGYQFGKYPPTEAGIQAAVNSLKDIVDENNGGVIHLALGNYTITNSIKVYPYITIKGDPLNSWNDILGSQPLLTFSSDSLSSIDSTKNFMFHFIDTITTKDTRFGLSNLAFKLDTIAGKTFSKYSAVYLQNGKASGTRLTDIYLSTIILDNYVSSSSSVFYVPGDVNNPTTQCQRTRFFVTCSDLRLTRDLSFSNTGIFYNETVTYAGSPSRYVEFVFLNNSGFHGNLYHADNWDAASPTGSILFQNNARTNIKVDSCALIIEAHYSFFQDNCTFYVKGFNNDMNRFVNCSFFSLNFYQISATGNGGSLFLVNCSSRNWAWSSGVKITLDADCQLFIDNSLLYQHSTAANTGVINFNTNGLAADIWVRNSTLLSKTSSNVSIYAAGATSGINYVFNSVLSDTTSINFTYTGSNNSWVAY